MAKPVPGKLYTVASGDSLSKIAAIAYGDSSLWPRIWKANQFELKSSDPNIIYPGEVIIIPVLPEREELKKAISSTGLPGKSKDDLTIIIDGEEIPVLNARVIRTMDTGADGWTASLDWKPGANSRLDTILEPYAYPPASVYIGGELVIKGLLYATETDFSINGSIKNLEGWSYTADAIDSSLKPPYEKNNITLKQLAEQIVRPLGINVIFDIDDDSTFDRVTADEGESVFDFLAKLAAQRSALVSSTVNGDLIITRAKVGAPVATLQEGGQGALSFTARFDGRQRFNVYRAVGDSPLGNKVGIAKDSRVPRSRFLTFKADETISGDIQKAAKWKRSKQLTEALTIPFPVDSWYDPKGNRWQENTIVTIVAPSLHLSEGFDFLIRSVEYEFSPQGRTAVLNVVPPQVYTGEDIQEPWS